MSTCNITAGYTLGCRDNTGGIKAIYVLSGTLDSVTESSGSISNISGSGSYYKFEQAKGVGDLTEVPTTSLEAGTIYYEQTVNVAFHKLQTSLRNQIKVLAQNPNLNIIVETNNGEETPYTGKFWMVGRFRGATLTGGTGGTGTAFGDANQYALTFTGQEPHPMYEVISSDGTLTSALTGLTVL